MTQPRTRAALLAGGILWRLAIESIGSSEVHERVLNGPSEEALRFGKYLLPHPDTNELVWDDTLTEGNGPHKRRVQRLYRSLREYF